MSDVKEVESYFVIVAWAAAWVLLIMFLVWVLLPALDVIFTAIGI